MAESFPGILNRRATPPAVDVWPDLRHLVRRALRGVVEDAGSHEEVVVGNRTRAQMVRCLLYTSRCV